jgi:hypothetical protein
VIIGSPDDGIRILFKKSESRRTFRPRAISLIISSSAGIRAPRIISNLQGRCGHEKAAEEAAQQENLISTLVEIV